MNPFKSGKEDHSVPELLRALDEERVENGRQALEIEGLRALVSIYRTSVTLALSLGTLPEAARKIVLTGLALDDGQPPEGPAGLEFIQHRSIGRMMRRERLGGKA